MARYSKKEQVSEETKAEALQVARHTQKPGQTKAQTKLIAQGVQKGIEQYKKQQKVKARELDKKIKKANAQLILNPPKLDVASTTQDKEKTMDLTLFLLIASWLFFAVYFFVGA